MAFFASEYEVKLDAKGRLMLPSKVKSNLPETSGSELVLRRGFEPCLEVYPMVEFNKLFSKIRGLNEFNPEHRALQRNFLSNTTQVELDGNGRMLIPKPMMRYAALENEAVIVGMGNRLEIWNPEKYQEFLIQDQAEFSKLAQKYLDA